MVFVLSSCDPGIIYNRVIENNSDHDLKVYIYRNNVSKPQEYYYEKDSFLINRHENISIAKWNSIGQASEFENCDTYADSIVVKVVDSKTLRLTLNLNERANWTFRRIKKSLQDGGECECRIILNNNHIR